MEEEPLQDSRFAAAEARRVRFERLLRRDWSVPVGERRLRFGRPNAITRRRVSTFFIKEPATLRWIDSMEPDDILWDVGANIGIYSLYAAAGKGMRVYAFEPYPENHDLLVKNVRLNGLEKNVYPICAALHDVTGLGMLRCADKLPGDSGHIFVTDARQPISDPGGRLLIATATPGFTIDDFIRTFRTGTPQHIKIDVDGNECLILGGAAETLRDPILKSVLVEIECAVPAYLASVVCLMIPAGFRLASRARTNLSPLVERCTTYNYVFVRND